MGPRRTPGGHEIDCGRAREALSALVDGEAPGLEPEVLSGHLAGCAPCRGFDAAVIPLVRAARLRVHTASPDLTAQILDALGQPPRQSAIAVLADRSWSVVRHPHWLRAGQWAAALVPLAVALPPIALGVLSPGHAVPSLVVTPCTAALFHQLGAELHHGALSLLRPHPR